MNDPANQIELEDVALELGQKDLTIIAMRSQLRRLESELAELRAEQNGYQREDVPTGQRIDG